MKILCLNPAPLTANNRHQLLVKEGRCMERSGAWSNLRMPLTLAYLSSILKKAGNKVMLIDAIAQKYLKQDLSIAKIITNFNPDIAIINTAFQSVMTEDLDNAQLIKSMDKNIKTIMIGVPPSLIDKQILKSDSIDICIRKEPESIILKLVDELKQPTPNLKKVKGITYKDNDKIIKNPDSKLITNLDLLPYPDYESLPLDAYRTPIDNEKQVLIDVSRGCTHNCIFCTGVKFYGCKLRLRNPKKIADEIEHVLNLGIKKIL